MRNLNRRVLAFNFAKEFGNGIILNYDMEASAFVPTLDKLVAGFYSTSIDVILPDENIPPSTANTTEYARFFEYLCRYMEVDMERFLSTGLLLQKRSINGESLDFDADIYHYKSGTYTFAIRHNVSQGTLPNDVTGRSSSYIAQGIVAFDVKGIKFRQDFIDNLLFIHKPERLDVKVSIMELANEPVIFLSIVPVTSEIEPELLTIDDEDKRYDDSNDEEEDS